MLMFLISLYLTTLYPDRVAGKDYAGAKIERAMLNNNWRLTISKEDIRKIKSKIKVTLEVDAFIQINTHTQTHINIRKSKQNTPWESYVSCKRPVLFALGRFFGGLFAFSSNCREVHTQNDAVEPLP